jgi:putative ABC transport system permease protein
MIYKHFLFAIRNLIKHKIATFLNIGGIALGLTCSIFILYFLKHELSYDKKFANYERIYRVNMGGTGQSDRLWAVVSPCHAREMNSFFPEIESISRLYKINPRTYEFIGENDEIKRFEESYGFFADTSVFDVFGLEFIAGNPLEAFKDEWSVVITESMAERYFGNEDPLNRIINYTGSENKLKVTGVIPDLDFNTHMKFDYLVSMSTLYEIAEQNGFSDWMESRWWAHFFTYFKLAGNSSIEQLESRLDDFTVAFYSSPDNTPEEILEGSMHQFQNISDIHLTSNLEQEITMNGNKNYVITFFIVAILILIIVSVNFINLSTSVAYQRIKEVGLRKVVGANRKQLSFQFLFEPLIITISAILFALFFVEILAPFFLLITGIEFSLQLLLTPMFILFLFGAIILFGVIVGIYPVRILSKFPPIFALQGSHMPQSKIGYLRKGLIVLQFMISVFVIFSTTVIMLQSEFFLNKDIGFNKENVIAIQVGGKIRDMIRDNHKSLKAEFISHSSITNAALSSNIPGERLSVEGFVPNGTENVDELPSVRVLRVDEDYFETMGIDKVEGISFSERTSLDSTCMINKVAKNALNIENIYGMKGYNPLREQNFEILGVIDDFNFASLHSEIEPLIIEFNPRWSRYLLVRYESSSINDVLAFIKEKTYELDPEYILNYKFIENQVEQQYKNELNMNKIFKSFTIFTIIISCLGLFGLSAFSAKLKTRETGIRKVLGASIHSINYNYIKEFAILTLIASVISIPFGYYAMNKWLESFMYRIEVYWWLGPVVIILALMIAILTLSFHAFRLSKLNPVQVIRHE